MLGRARAVLEGHLDSQAIAGPRYSALVVAGTREQPSSRIRLTPWPVVMSIIAARNPPWTRPIVFRTVVSVVAG